MKNKIIKVLVFSLVLMLLFGTVEAFAFESYDTYTYSIDGLPLMSPTAYSASISMGSYDLGLDVKLNSATDIFSDNEANVYISDTGNNRIVVLNKYYSAVATISEYTDEFGRKQTLNAPEGIYVTDPNKTSSGESYIYVCDTGNRRIVVFDRSYNYVRTIECPDSPLVAPNDFVPRAIAVDIYGRIFLVADTDEGIIVLSGDGEFTGYIGAQKVSVSFIEKILRKFQPLEDVQSKSASRYNNITVDDDGFVYATIEFKEEDWPSQLSSIKSKNATYSPVKKLNSTGVEIMKRNGFFDPGGEVNVFYADEVSMINDVALGAEGSWTILDRSRSKLFTYDQNGNLLFAFGSIGDQLGNGEEFKGMTYQIIDGVYYLLLLDKTADDMKVTVYSPTEYCDTIMSALRNQNTHRYSESIDYWQEVLTRNNNFDLAYIGIGKALYSQGKYAEAQEVLSRAYETAYSSKAFTEQRQQMIGKLIVPIVLVAAVVAFALMKFLGYAKKKNKATTLKVGKKTYWEELLFVFHLVFHPFDGFWDLRHERRGSVRAATTFLGITILSFFYNSIGKGYLFNPRGSYSTIFISILSIALPVILWAVSNWCLTTLFDGEGRFRDIYIATCYSLAPLSLMMFVSTLLTNVLTSSEASIVSLITSIGFIWSIILIFFGMLVTHDYSLSKNVVTTLGTIVAMIIIMFVAVLFSSLLVKMVTFVTTLFSEIANRI